MKSTNLAKYHSKNPLKRWLLERFLSQIEQLVFELQPQSILDVGCGEGLVLQRLSNQEFSLTGVDISPEALQLARTSAPRAKLLTMNATHLNFKNHTFDLVIMLEVLEHLSDSVAAIKEANRVSKRYCLFSVPHEPWFSLLSLIAGMHFSGLGRHPEHLNFWSDKAFMELLKPYFKHIKCIRSFPWTIVVAEV